MTATPVLPVGLNKPTCPYILVSTANKSRHAQALAFDQNPAKQEQPLRELAEQGGLAVAKVYRPRDVEADEKRSEGKGVITDAGIYSQMNGRCRMRTSARRAEWRVA